MPKNLQNIMVAYDGFEYEEGIPALSGVLAKEHNARLHVVHVVHVAAGAPQKLWRTSAGSATELQAMLIEDRRRKVEAMAKSLEARGVSVRVVIRTGSPHIELIREAEEIGADLLMVTDKPARRRACRGFGAVTKKLLRKCPCPVLAKRSPRRYKHSRVMAAVDLDDQGAETVLLNCRIMDMATLLAQRASPTAHLDVFHAWSLWGEQLLRGRGRTSGSEINGLLGEKEQQASQYLHHLVSDYSNEGLEIRALIAKGEAHDLIPAAAERNKIDLLVMGTVSRTGLSGYLIGNTAERILDRLPCSVLTVKPEGFVSPVSKRHRG